MDSLEIEVNHSGEVAEQQPPRSPDKDTQEAARASAISLVGLRALGQVFGGEAWKR